jgi:ABC-type sugar transport system ATPase subunit
VISVSGLTIRQGTFALANISFTVPAGGYAVLTGPTGCGKTTVLECVAGLRSPSAGMIQLCDRDVSILPPAGRNVGYVPQDAAIFTHLTVGENLAFALTVRKRPRAEVEARVRELGDQLGLAPLLNRRAVGLSGGEAQRVALGRALAFGPRVLLLDEPLNAVDAATVERLVTVLKEVRTTDRPTVLHVTHSPDEVKGLADIRLSFDGTQIVLTVPPPSGGITFP